MSEHSMNQALPSDDGGQPEPKSPRQAQTDTVDIGHRLATERQARGWTIAQVADQLNLASRQIQALEQENYAALPGMASVRGFIRAYAKLLRIDATPLIATLANEDATPPAIESLHSRRPLTAPFSDVRNLPVLANRSWLSRSILASIVIVLAIVGVFAARHFGGIKMPALSTGNSASVASISSDPAPISTESAAGRADKIMPTMPASETGVPVPVDVPVVQVTAPLPASSKNTLELKMHEDSWIEIRRAAETALGDGGVLLSNLEKAGTTETFEITEPVVVTVGNASGVEATLRGERIDLKLGLTNAKSNVAHLILK